MAILLIGSTGNGKSTFGNFLINPSDENLFENQPFKIAQTNLPETQNVSAVSFRWKHHQFMVIDTPGLNESNVHDLRHMIQIVERLENVKAILACVLVVKFNAKIDAQYKATVEYYRKLLPSLFERNVIIVMTDFATDARTEQMRTRQRIDVDQIKRNTIREIVESGSLTYQPLLFTIDCLPFDEEEKKLSLGVRSAICSKIVSQKPFTSKDLKVAKTAYLIMEDKEKIKGYEGEITGYNKRLQQANTRAKEALEKIQNKEQEITDKVKELNALQSDLCDKDSPELTSIGSWSVSEEWKFLQWLSKAFEKTTTCEIEDVDMWTNGHCEWKDYEQTQYTVKGRIEGKFMRGIYASITLQASKRKKYASKIQSLRQLISEAEQRRRILEQHLSEIRDRYNEYTDDIKLLEKFIAEKREIINTLVSDYMTLDQARERLKAIEKN